MSPATEELLRNAQLLPGGERVELISALIAGLDDEPPIDAAMLAEVHRRSAAYDRGETTASPWTEVRARLQARLQGRG